MMNIIRIFILMICSLAANAQHSLSFGVVPLGRCAPWVQWFVDWYNTAHLHSSIQFVTPAHRHAGHHADILAHRKQVYRDAKARHPQRWSGNTRNWTPVGEVDLNPETPTREINKDSPA
jgi:putative transposase